MRALPTRYLRIAVQTSVFAMWVALICATHHPLGAMEAWLTQKIPVSIMLQIDPLVATVVMGGMRTGITLLMLGGVTLGITFLLGRVFCGWICPLGAIFDVYGWILRKLRVSFEGPSPSWFRLKYYLLLIILILALLGGVSPLIGLDPIVLLTRTVAAVINPFWRKRSEFFWQVGGPVGTHGQFFDLLTLLLFLSIMSATTRLSRIWCRTACPLGAYLAAASRHSILRRETSGCVHCNICARHCPTGAISFENPEVYNESECIKCFSCSQECPIDANFFTLKAPIAFTPSHAPVQLERRQFLGATATALVAAPALNLSAGNPLSNKKLIRPPMSRDEHDFLSSCIRCGECMKACPSGILKPAGLEHGFRALWSPVMVATEGSCIEGCNACSQACPTDAIMKYPVEKKYAFKAGTAILESDRCISYTENKFCSECVRACPTDAIQIQKGWSPEIAPGDTVHGSDTPAPAGKTPTRPIHIDIEKCVGCGACEYSCNTIVFGEPAMILTSFGRATPTHLTPASKGSDS